MKRTSLLVSVCAAGVGLAAVVGSVAMAEPSHEGKPAGQPEMQLPPGWTEADMMACVQAGTPGEMHEHLASGVGVWHGDTTMWMGSGGEPMHSECTSKVTSIMDGRYTKCEIEGEMPGMGPYHASGVYGFDNVSGKFVSDWIDNHSTGIMRGVGELSRDGKTMTWEYTFNCPITKKPAVLREVETIISPTERTLEMYGTDPKSGEEYKMMVIEFTKDS